MIKKNRVGRPPRTVPAERTSIVLDKPVMDAVRIVAAFEGRTLAGALRQLVALGLRVATSHGTTRSAAQ